MSQTLTPAPNSAIVEFADYLVESRDASDGSSLRQAFDHLRQELLRFGIPSMAKRETLPPAPQVAVAVKGYCALETCCRTGDGQRSESLHLSWHIAAFEGAMAKLAVETQTPREEASLSSPDGSVRVRT